MSSPSLPSLLHNRWSVPVLAELARGGVEGGRFANLTSRLGVSRESLRRTLAALVEAGFVMRNPGHGHPLRPEYILTLAGEPVAAFCMKVMAQREALGLDPAQMPRWSLPLISNGG